MIESVDIDIHLVLKAAYETEFGEYLGMKVCRDKEDIDFLIKGKFREFLDLIAEEFCKERCKNIVNEEHRTWQ